MARMSDLLTEVRNIEKEGFSSDAQRRAAFASGYKEKGKKKKEETELGEKFTKKDFQDNESANNHTENGVKLVNMYGTPAEKKLMAQIAKNHDKRGSIEKKEQELRDKLVKKYYPKLESVELDELNYQFMVLDKDGRVMGMTTGEKDAERQAKGDNIRGETGKVVKLRGRGVSQRRGDSMMGHLPADNLGEALDKKDEPKVKGIIKKLKKASDAHAGQATDLEKAINEDGHTDVASAVRQCKTVVEDATQMMSKLQSMSPEDSLPTWWSNKLAVASNSMNKMRDYLLVPSMSEEVELDEKADDLKKARELMSPAKHRGDGIKRIMKGMNVDKTKATKMHDAVMKSYGFKPESFELDEGKMKELHGYISAGKSAEQIAKIMKLDVKTIKALMKEDVEVIEGYFPEAKSSSGYDLYHKEFSGAMQHAYAHAKKKFGITIDPDEIDDKVATGPSKPSKGKTNSYRLKGDKGTVQIQVYNMGSRYELNMYKEEVELGEGYESEVLKVLKDADVEGYFKMGKLYVSKRDAKDAKKALEDSDEITKLPKMVMEEVELDEGTLALPNSMADFRGIVNLMKRPIKAKDAERAISKFIDDDDIANGIITLKNKDPNADARPAIMRGFNRLKIYTKGEPSYGTTIKFNRKFEIQDKNIKKTIDRPPSEDRDNMGFVRMEEVDPADVDITATDKDVENASKNIILQLRKVITLRGMKPVEFASGKEKVNPNVAQAALSMHQKLRRTDEKDAFQRKIARSYKDLLNAVKGRK